MTNPRKRQRKAKKSLHDQVHEDMKSLENVMLPLAKRIIKVRKEKRHIESFVLTWGLIEQLVLPAIIRSTADKLEFEQLPELERMTGWQLINVYYLLSHDKELISPLLKANEKRNNLLHKFAKGNIKVLNNQARSATAYTLKNVLEPLLMRMRDYKLVPSLNLYSKGFEDFRQLMLAELKKD